MVFHAIFHAQARADIFLFNCPLSSLPKQLASEAWRTETAVVCLGMHTFVAGTPGHAKALGATLRRLKQCPGVAFATASQIQIAAMSTTIPIPSSLEVFGKNGPELHSQRQVPAKQTRG